MPSAFGCFSARRGRDQFYEVEGDEVKMMHAWQLIVKYYELKVCIRYIKVNKCSSTINCMQHILLIKSVIRMY